MSYHQWLDQQDYNFKNRGCQQTCLVSIDEGFSRINNQYEFTHIPVDSVYI